jgi:cytochrome c biogenesis protein CcdA
VASDYSLALAAGMLAAVNPCGFALLPAYLSLLVVGGGGQPTSRISAIGRSLRTAAAMSLGFVAVFGAFGLLAAPLADRVARSLPWASIALGLALVAMGAWLLAGRDLPDLLPKRSRAPDIDRRAGSPRQLLGLAGFGAAYAIASLGCTIGPFLAVVVTTLRSSSVLSGVGLFIAYALGMALVVGCVALAVALANTSFVRTVRRMAPVINRAGGALLVLAGAYVAWYGWYELRVYRDATVSDDVVVEAAARIQAALSSMVQAAGAIGVAVTFVALLAAAVATAWLRRRHSPGQG